MRKQKHPLVALLLSASLALSACVANLNPQPRQATQQDIENSKALIESFSTGDTSVARALLAEDYIQHNLAVATGAQGFIRAVENLSQAPIKTTVQTLREFSDGDKVVLHNLYNFAGQGDVMAFDIFCIDNKGKIAEHWDNISPVAPPNPNGHSQIDGTLKINTQADTEQTREIVRNFSQDILQAQNLENFSTYFDGDNYIQHNSHVADGVTSVITGLQAMREQGLIYHKIHQILASGDFALVVSEGEIAGQATAFYDLFRVENGKIAEHWDVIETIADPSTWQHNNGKF